MDKKENKYAQLALTALKRASRKVAENAIKKNVKVPYWINGKVEYKVPSLPLIHSHEDIQNIKFECGNHKRQL